MRKRLLAFLIFSAAADAQPLTVIIRAGTLLDGKGGVDAYLARDVISRAPRGANNLDRAADAFQQATDWHTRRPPKTDMTTNLDCLFKDQIGRRSSSPTARFGTTEEPLADARGSDQSHDRKGVISRKSAKPGGHGTSVEANLLLP